MSRQSWVRPIDKNERIKNDNSPFPQIAGPDTYNCFHECFGLSIWKFARDCDSKSLKSSKSTCIEIFDIM